MRDKISTKEIDIKRSMMIYRKDKPVPLMIWKYKNKEIKWGKLLENICNYKRSMINAKRSWIKQILKF